MYHLDSWIPPEIVYCIKKRWRVSELWRLSRDQKIIFIIGLQVVPIPRLLQHLFYRFLDLAQSEGFQCFGLCSSYLLISCMRRKITSIKLFILQTNSNVQHKFSLKCIQRLLYKSQIMLFGDNNISYVAICATCSFFIDHRLITFSLQNIESILLALINSVVSFYMLTIYRKIFNFFLFFKCILNNSCCFTIHYIYERAILSPGHKIDSIWF